MAEFSWQKTHRKVQLGDKGDDWFDFDIPANEVLLAATLSGGDQANAGFSFKQYPEFGATGHQHIGVHWWFDGTFIGGPGRVAYNLNVVTGVPGKVLMFEGHDFEGAFRLATLPVADMSRTMPAFNDTIASIVVLKGNWIFYRDPNFANPFMKNGRPIVLPSGMYSRLEDIGLVSDTISSMRCVTDPANF